MRLFNSFSLVNLFQNVLKQILMRRWKLAQKLFLSSDGFCRNNFEYIYFYFTFYDLCGSDLLNTNGRVLFYRLISYRYQAS